MTSCNSFFWVLVLALVRVSCSSSRTPSDGGVDASLDAADSGGEDALDGASHDAALDGASSDSDATDTMCRGMEEPCTVDEDCCSYACSVRLRLCGMPIDP